MSFQAGQLTDAAALLNNILASAESIRTLANATTTGATTQQPVASGAHPVKTRLRTLFPSGGRSSRSRQPLAAAGPVRTSVPRYQAQCFGTWTTGTRRKR